MQNFVSIDLYGVLPLLLDLLLPYNGREWIDYDERRRISNSQWRMTVMTHFDSNRNKWCNRINFLVNWIDDGVFSDLHLLDGSTRKSWPRWASARSLLVQYYEKLVRVLFMKEFITIAPLDFYPWIIWGPDFGHLIIKLYDTSITPSGPVIKLSMQYRYETIF